MIDAPDVQKRYRELSFEPKHSTPEDYRVIIADEVAKWDKVVSERGIVME